MARKGRMKDCRIQRAARKGKRGTEGDRQRGKESKREMRDKQITMSGRNYVTIAVVLQFSGCRTNPSNGWMRQTPTNQVLVLSTNNNVFNNPCTHNRSKMYVIRWTRYPLLALVLLPTATLVKGLTRAVWQRPKTATAGDTTPLAVWTSRGEMLHLSSSVDDIAR